VMKSNPEGRAILEEMANLKIIDRVWDTLYTHTAMTQKMIDYITRLSSQNGNDIEIAIKIINHYYQDWLKSLLLNWTPSNIWYEDIVNIFLKTSNRSYWNNIKWLKDLWITQVIHWHNSQKNGRTTEIDWIKFMDIDTNYWKPGLWGGYNGEKAAFKIEWTKEVIETETSELEEDTIES
jgi:hypothetical protein